MARFEVSKERLDEARRKLGIRSPVVVRIVRYSWTYGGYIGERDGVHRIGVDHRLSPRSASQTIWHELGHVRQAEHVGGLSCFDAEFERQLAAVGVSGRDLSRGRFSTIGKYNRTPFEREAEQVARRNRRNRLTRKRARGRRRRRRRSRLLWWR